MRVLRSRGDRGGAASSPSASSGSSSSPTLIEASESERAELLEGAAGGLQSGLLGLGGAAAEHGVGAAGGRRPFLRNLARALLMCANVAAAGPLCVVVDDVQWADAALAALPGVPGHARGGAGVTLPLAATRPTRAGRRRGAAPDADGRALPPTSFVSGHFSRGPRSPNSWNRRSKTPPDPGFVDAALRSTRGIAVSAGASSWGALRESGIRRRRRRLARSSESARGSIGRSIQLRLGRLPEPAIRLARGAGRS